MENNECYTYFSITGDFDPDLVTEKLKLHPVRTWKKGDPRGHHGTYDFSSWSFGLCREYDICTENQMHKTIAPLLDKIDLLCQIRNTWDVSLSLQIVPTVYVGNSTPTLSPTLDVIDFCHATRTTIDIGLYVYANEEAE